MEAEPSDDYEGFLGVARKSMETCFLENGLVWDHEKRREICRSGTPYEARDPELVGYFLVREPTNTALKIAIDLLPHQETRVDDQRCTRVLLFSVEKGETRCPTGGGPIVRDDGPVPVGLGGDDSLTLDPFHQIVTKIFIR